MKTAYESPEVLILTVIVESGYELSVGGGAFGDGDDQVDIPTD